MKKRLWLALFVSGCFGMAQAQTGNWNFPQCQERVGTVLASASNGVFTVRRENIGAAMTLNWASRTILIQDAKGANTVATGLLAYRSGNLLVIHAYVTAGLFRGSSIMGLLAPIGNNLWQVKLTLLPLPYLPNGVPVATYELNC